MEHTTIDVNSLVVDICYECFSKEASFDFFWVDRYEQWGKSLEKAGAILKAQIELEQQNNPKILVVGDYPQYWQKISFVLIHGYGVQIPCYKPLNKNKAQETIGFLSLDGIINTALDWQQNNELEWQFIENGLFWGHNYLEKFIKQAITSTKK